MTQTKLRFHHISLSVCLAEESIRFYCELFGFQPILEHSQANGWRIVHIRAPDIPMIIELIEVEHTPPTLGVHLGFSTQAFDNVLKLIHDNDVTVEREPFQVGNEHIVLIRDPDGYLIEINDGLEVL